MKLLNDDDDLNPASSMINLVDVFLVLIAALLITIAQNPLNPFTAENVTVIKNEVQDDMEVIVKKGETFEHFESTGENGGGQGTKAGVAYKMADGTMVYVPE